MVSILRLLVLLVLIGAPGQKAAAFWLNPAGEPPKSFFRSPDEPEPEPEPEPPPSVKRGPIDAAPLSDWTLCGAYAEVAEQMVELPSRLLLSIAQAESGRVTPDKQAVSAWPWTVMAEGKGRYLPSKAAAIAEVRQLQARGVRNIDVGCMQINLRWHPAAFDDLEQAFNPAFNVAYGAVFLADLYGRTRSWTEAVGRYHSATPKYSSRYRARVLDLWEKARNEGARATSMRQ